MNTTTQLGGSSHGSISQKPAPSKDIANPSAKTALQADQGTGENPSQKKSQ